ncbi:hypothetical protein DFH07DRAFT_338754 [Mycena maculata]|uniref:Uncharacterized protein n=1 Tax=Mycena maculata TaxID=230809 RepID=A0AAD7MHP4_9AGAR|nr:hypothetical protein DFH07DRAFT_338754 [Mycena maculata]
MDPCPWSLASLGLRECVYAYIQELVRDPRYASIFRIHEDRTTLAEGTVDGSALDCRQSDFPASGSMDRTRRKHVPSCSAVKVCTPRRRLMLVRVVGRSRSRFLATYYHHHYHIPKPKDVPGSGGRRSSRKSCARQDQLAREDLADRVLHRRGRGWHSQGCRGRSRRCAPASNDGEIYEARMFRRARGRRRVKTGAANAGLGREVVAMTRALANGGTSREPQRHGCLPPLRPVRPLLGEMGAMPELDSLHHPVHLGGPCPRGKTTILSSPGLLAPSFPTRPANEEGILKSKARGSRTSLPSPLLLSLCIHAFRLQRCVVSARSE